MFACKWFSFCSKLYVDLFEFLNTNQDIAESGGMKINTISDMKYFVGLFSLLDFSSVHNLSRSQVEFGL